MKLLKYPVWLLIGNYFLNVGNPYVFNGSDLLGWIIIGYTVYKFTLFYFLNEKSCQNMRSM